MMLNDSIGTVHLRTEKVAEAVRVFEAHASGVDRAFIAPPLGGWTALYPRESDAARRWAEIISRELKITAVAFQVLDDEVFAYQLFTNGRLIDEFASKPSYFLGLDDEVDHEKIKALRGNPLVWEPFLVNGRQTVDVGKLLSSGFDDPRLAARGGCDYLIPTTILEDLCSMIGIAGASSTYDDINDNIQEWQEDRELADDGEADASECLDCGRHARDIKHVRAPRRAQPAVSPKSGERAGQGRAS